MNDQNYTTSFLVNQGRREAFDAINNVRSWWTANLVGETGKAGDEFEVRFGDVHYSKQRLVDVVENEKVVWLVTDSRLSFVEDKQEWNNTRIVFDLITEGEKTRVRFTHVGLSPDVECHDACSNAWSGYINVSLKSLIETGEGKGELKDA